MQNKTKIATTSGLSIMMFASLMAPSMQTANAGIGDLCDNLFGLDTWDSNFVSDPDTGDFIFVFKCFIPDVNCLDNDAIPANDAEDVPKKSMSSTTCNGFLFATYSNLAEAIATDSVPAEWNALGADCFVAGGSVEVKGSKSQGATVIECPSEAFGSFFVAVGFVEVLETRANPGQGHKEGTVYKPTSCVLYKNEGAEGLVPGRTYDHDSMAATPEIPFSTGLTDPLPVTVVGPGC